MRYVFIFLLALSVFYLFTGLVFNEGGFGFQLIVKREPSIEVSFGGGEEGSWAREHPGAAKPYWQTKQKFVLAEGDWEGGQPWWEIAYFCAYGLLWLAWPIFACVTVVRLIWKAYRSGRGRDLPMTLTGE